MLLNYLHNQIYKLKRESLKWTEIPFVQALEKNIDRGSTFCLRENDGSPSTRLIGGILFSSSNAPKYKLGGYPSQPKREIKEAQHPAYGQVV